MKLKAIFLAGILCAFSAFADTVATENMSEDELIAAAERLIEQEKAAEKKVGKSAVDEEIKIAQVDESQIPAFRGPDKAAQSTSSPWTRLIVGMSVVLVLALGLLLAAKRFGKKGLLQNANVRMDIVSQKALSPKQNLVLVRVAGEHILLGATDHSINLIKSVSLIDDEAESSLPQDFNNFLEDEFVHENLNDKKSRTFTI